jgi:hypothetical protein
VFDVGIPVVSQPPLVPQLNPEINVFVPDPTHKVLPFAGIPT